MVTYLKLDDKSLVARKDVLESFLYAGEPYVNDRMILEDLIIQLDCEYDKQVELLRELLLARRDNLVRQIVNKLGQDYNVEPAVLYASAIIALNKRIDKMIEHQRPDGTSTLRQYIKTETIREIFRLTGKDQLGKTKLVNRLDESNPFSENPIKHIDNVTGNEDGIIK